jgi:hypothetical protein
MSHICVEAPEPIIDEPLLLDLTMLTCAGAHQHWPCTAFTALVYHAATAAVCNLWYR